MKHKQLFTFLSMFALSCINAVSAYGDEQVINIQYKGHHGTHNDFPMPADVPDVYYDAANQSIIIDGSGCVSYYDVEITSLSSWTVHVSTQVSGYYDTIDISSLPQDDYVITIDSPMGNSYEGFFDTY